MKCTTLVLADVNNWKRWAPWVRGVAKSSARDWTVETDDGALHLHFVDSSSLAIFDHTVTRASGDSIYNAMRVSPNASGSELSMVVLQTAPQRALSSSEMCRPFATISAVSSECAGEPAWEP